jgi:hypothetical protein
VLQSKLLGHHEADAPAAAGYERDLPADVGLARPEKQRADEEEENSDGSQGHEVGVTLERRALQHLVEVVRDGYGQHWFRRSALPFELLAPFDPCVRVQVGGGGGGGGGRRI